MLSGGGLKDNIWPSTVGIWSVLGTSVSLPCEVFLSDTGRITVLNTTMLSIIENLQINKNKYLLIKNKQTSDRNISLQKSKTSWS